MVITRKILIKNNFSITFVRRQMNLEKELIGARGTLGL
jgi:hypothetical protein